MFFGTHSIDSYAVLFHIYAKLLMFMIAARVAQRWTYFDVYLKQMLTMQFVDNMNLYVVFTKLTVTKLMQI